MAKFEFNVNQVYSPCDHKPKYFTRLPFDETVVDVYLCDYKNIHFFKGDYALNLSNHRAKQTTEIFKPFCKLEYTEVMMNWPDYEVPHLDFQVWPFFLNWLTEQPTKENKKCKLLIHCEHGHGRTGTAAAIFLVIQGFSAKEAIAYVRKIHCSKAIETKAQLDYIFAFERFKFKNL